MSTEQEQIAAGIEAGIHLAEKLKIAKTENARLCRAWEEGLELVNVLKDRIAVLTERQADLDAAYKEVMSETCVGDEHHCTCVPYLREEITKLRAVVKAADELRLKAMFHGWPEAERIMDTLDAYSEAREKVKI